MQQTLFPKHDESDSKNKVSALGRGLAIQFIKPGSEARLFRNGVFIKTVDLSDKTARRLFVVDTVELGVTKALLAKALGISRQTIHNYIEMQKHFGREGLINSYHAANSKSRATQRKEQKEKLSKGNKARLLEAMRGKEREAKEQQDESAVEIIP
jgi:transposase